jgi:hypothetical protein
MQAQLWCATWRHRSNHDDATHHFLEAFQRIKNDTKSS